MSHKPRVSLVVAVADNGVIGRENSLPWRLPADLRHFKKITIGKPIVMGRATRDSIGRALPGRTNIVLSRNPGYRQSGTETAESLDEAIALGARQGAAEIMIIGGAAIYEQALPLAARIYLTQIHAAVRGDRFFPHIGRGAWREIDREDFPASAEARMAYSFVTLERR